MKHKHAVQKIVDHAGLTGERASLDYSQSLYVILPVDITTRQTLPSYAKIGISSNPIERGHQLQTGSPHPLLVAMSMPGGKRLESALHWWFEHHRHNREWFAFSHEMGELLVELYGAVQRRFSFSGPDMHDLALAKLLEVYQVRSTAQRDAVALLSAEAKLSRAEWRVRLLERQALAMGDITPVCNRTKPLEVASRPDAEPHDWELAQ